MLAGHYNDAKRSHDVMIPGFTFRGQSSRWFVVVPLLLLLFSSQSCGLGSSQGDGCNERSALPEIRKAADSGATTLEIHQVGSSTPTLFGVCKDIKILPPEIGQLTSLQNLDLSLNSLTTLPPEIGLLTNLQELRLYANGLTVLPPEIGQLTKLRKLELKNNALTKLPPEIGQLTNLEELDLSYNDISALPPEMGQLDNLQELDLSGNPLVARECERLRNQLPATVKITCGS